MIAPAFTTPHATVYAGDALEVLRELPDGSVDCVVTSPPYWGLRDYGVAGQLGLEKTPAEYVERMVEVFREVRRALTKRGTLWLNLGDSYRGLAAPGLKPKDMVGIPWRVAFALQADGWWLRSDIIWAKPNPMPESVTDRPTKAHEYVFLFSKSPRYYYDGDAIAERVADTSLARWNQNVASQAGSDRVPGKTNGTMKAVGGPHRPQAQRAVELAVAAGLTPEHIAAIRAVGITDVGKARDTQDGAGKNDPLVQILADEAKAALGGYYREFLIAEVRNARTVWTIATQPYPEAHFATFPEELPRRCIKAGCPEGVCATCGKPRERLQETTYNVRAVRSKREKQYDTGDSGARANMPFMGDAIRTTTGWTDCGHDSYRRGVVLDPFAGSGTTLAVARDLGRRSIGIELNPEYVRLIDRRLAQLALAVDE